MKDNEAVYQVLPEELLRDPSAPLYQQMLHLEPTQGFQCRREIFGQDLVDRLVIFQSPITLGGDALSPFSALPGNYRETLAKKPIVRRAEFGDDVMTVYALREA